METRRKVKKPIYKRVWFWILIALALFFLIPFSIGIVRGVKQVANGEYVAPTPKPTTVPTPEESAAPELTQTADPKIPLTEGSTVTPAIAPTPTPTPSTEPTKKPTTIPTAAPTPTEEPSVSDNDKAIYTDVMWAIMHGELDREEAAIKKDYANKYSMTVDELDALIRRIEEEAYSNKRDPIAEHKCDMFGTVESIVDYWDGMCVISVLIEPSYSNEATVAQNFHNIESLILEGGGDMFREIQYHAFMKTATGERLKAATFTVDADLISAIKSGTVLATTMSDYLDDLWVTSQLR